jgi:hypothetical protein
VEQDGDEGAAASSETAAISMKQPKGSEKHTRYTKRHMSAEAKRSSKKESHRRDRRNANDPELRERDLLPKRPIRRGWFD